MSKNAWIVIAITVLLGMDLAMFGDVLFTDKTTVLSKQGLDLFDQFIYWRAFGFNELRQGNLALWNPHVFSGVPFFGGFQSALLYPLNLPYLILPVWRAINVSIALHVLLSGIFMYLWAARRKLHPLGCLVSATLLMFCGAHFMHINPGHLPHLCTMTWTPLLFLSIDGLFERRSLGWCLLGIFSITMQILAGYPQHLYFTAVAASTYCGLCLIKARKRGLMALVLVGMCAGSFALGAIQILTGFEVAGETVRSGGLPYEFASRFSFPPENFVTLLAPGFFGNDITFPYWGRWYLWEMSLFVGVTGFLLAIYGSIYGEKNVRRFSVTMALLLLLLALGAYTPLFAILHAWFPGFNRFRGSSKFIFQATLFISLLAGIGVDHIHKNRSVPRKMILATIMGAILVGTVALCIQGSANGNEPMGWWQKSIRAVAATNESYFLKRTDVDQTFVEQAGVFASKSFMTTSGMLVVLTLLLFLVRSSEKAVYAIVFLAIAEIFLFARASRATFDLTALRQPETEKFLAKHQGDYRILNTRHPNSAMSMGLKDVWGYDSVVLRRYAEFITFTQGYAAADATQYVKFSKFPELYGMLRCRFAFVPGMGKTEIIQNNNIMPRLKLIHEYMVISERDQILAKLGDPSFDPSRTIILEKTPDPEPLKSEQVGMAIVVDASTDHLVIEADLPSPAILLITDTYSKGWQAWALAGSSQREYEVLPADYILRAIPMSAGHHRIRVEYLPKTFVIGKWVSIASAIVYMFLVGYYVRKTSYGRIKCLTSPKDIRI